MAAPPSFYLEAWSRNDFSRCEGLEVDVFITYLDTRSDINRHIGCLYEDGMVAAEEISCGGITPGTTNVFYFYTERPDNNDDNTVTEIIKGVPEIFNC